MGKSPGRWIKAVLFGKKRSISRSSKNATPDKKASIKTAGEDQVGNTLDISSNNHLTENGASNVEPEKGTPAALSNANSSGDIQGPEAQALSFPPSDDDLQRQNQSAAKAQAAFRGYLARRAFRALKGIIRLQALIRGHLVRRQAVATLHCMQAIVKLQAAVREWNVGRQKFQVNVGTKSVMNSEMLAANSYIRKLLSSVATPMPLALQYEGSEPNSASNWLERWSHSRFWATPARPRKVSSVKAHMKHQQTVENHIVKSKRTSRKADKAQNGENGVFSSADIDGKRSLKKGELAQDQPQHELERVKRNLRKISESVTAASDKVDPIIEKPPPQLNAETGSQPMETVIDADKTVNGVESAVTDETFDPPQSDLPTFDTNSSENGGGLKNGHEECNQNEERSVKKNQKVRRSLPAKPEFSETASQNTPLSIPSYMAATESAKAKLRASGSSKEGGDGAGHVRRHSLPSFSNGKMISLSPRIQQHPYGKGTNKNVSDKLLQPGWKR